jgi:hypothetical protein
MVRAVIPHHPPVPPWAELETRLWAGKTTRIDLKAPRNAQDDADDRNEREAIQSLEREEDEKWKVRQRTLFS